MSDQVYLFILENTDCSSNLEAFIKLRSVCRLFYQLSHSIGAPIKYSYETLRALSPRLAQTTNYMLLNKFISVNVSVPERITDLEFSSGSPEITISGNYLHNLIVDSRATNLLPKMCFDRVDNLEMQDLEQGDKISISFLKHLCIKNYTQWSKFTSFISAFSHSLESLRLSVGQNYAIGCEDVFTNLVFLENFNPEEKNMENFPKATFFVDCFLPKDFFNKPYGLLYRNSKEEPCLEYIESENFEGEIISDLVLVLDNFTADSPYVDCIEDCCVLYIEGKVKQDNVPKLLSLIKVSGIYSICIGSQFTQENITERIRANFPEIDIVLCDGK